VVLAMRIMRILIILLVATLVLIAACAPAQHTLNTSVSPSDAGTITPTGGTYDAGTEVEVTATASEGYVFDLWSGGITGTSSSVTLVMDSDKSIVAHFFKPSIGTMVSGDVWQLKVVSVKKATTLAGSAYSGESYSAKPGYSFLVVELHIENVSATDQPYHSSNFAVTDSEKRVYTVIGSQIGLDEYFLGSTFTGSMAPGGVFSDDCVFGVPNDAKGFHFKFQDLPSIDLGQ